MQEREAEEQTILCPLLVVLAAWFRFIFLAKDTAGSLIWPSWGFSSLPKWFFDQLWSHPTQPNLMHDRLWQLILLVYLGIVAVLLIRTWRGRLWAYYASLFLALLSIVYVGVSFFAIRYGKVITTPEVFYNVNWSSVVVVLLLMASYRQYREYSTSKQQKRPPTNPDQRS